MAFTFAHETPTTAETTETTDPTAPAKAQGHAHQAPSIRSGKPSETRTVTNWRNAGLYRVSHSTFYRYLSEGIVPKPDGYILSRPYWLTGSIAPHFIGTQVTQAEAA